MGAFELTPAQREAVENPGTPILVSAAAGSGKTRVLVERLLRQVCDPVNPCNVDDFLVITFTEKAAGELRTRIAKEISQRLSQTPQDRHLQKQLNRIYLAQISTIHSFCGRLLREYAYELNLPADFRQLQKDDSAQIRSRVLTELLEQRYQTIGQDAELQALIDTLGVGRDDKTIPLLLDQVYQTVRCHLSPEKWVEQCLNKLETEQYTDLAQTPWGKELLLRLHERLELCRAWLCSAIDLAQQCEALKANRTAQLTSELELVRRLLNAQSWDEIYAQRSPKYATLSQKKPTEDEELWEQIRFLRNAAKTGTINALAAFSQPSEALLAELTLTKPAIRGLFRLEQEYAAAYRAKKLRLHCLDFGDLEHEAVRLLLTPEGTPTRAAAEISQRYREIMLDEYQDTNELQDAICGAISTQNRFLVGDVKQSIYRFRLADPAIFLQKYKQYPDYTEAGTSGPRKIFLSENFRSGDGILEAVNAVFTVCMSETTGGLRYAQRECLRAGCAHEPLPYPQTELHCFETGAQGDDDALSKYECEAEYLAGRIEAMLRERLPIRGKDDVLRPVRPGDIVILMRSVRKSAGYFIEALNRHGVQAQCSIGGSFLDTPALESLLALLQVLDNAHQDIPLAAAMLSPLFGFTAQELAELRAGHKNGDLLEAVLASPAPRVREFADTLTRLREEAAQSTLYALLGEIRRVTELDGVYGAMADGAARLAGVQRFQELAAEFEKGGQRSLHQFLSYLETYSVSDGEEQANAEAVRIMTIHGSKGLEFPVVLLADLSKTFNREDAQLPLLLDPELGAGCNVYDRENRVKYPSVMKIAITNKQFREDRSEELRVLYVAMTRAKDLLIMTYSGKNLEKKLTELARQITLPLPEGLAATANCMGFWVLLAAAFRPEASELFPPGSRAFPLTPVERKWCIRLHTNMAIDEQTAQRPVSCETPDSTDAQAFAQMLSFQYPAASTVPAKITATQLKGRRLDAEIADGEENIVSPPRLKQPELILGERTLTPTERGTAMHLAMQYLDFSQTGSLTQICAELTRMVDAELLTVQQAKCVQPERLLRVFTGPLGKLISQAQRVIREFKFSTLTDARKFFPEAAGEKLLLQGVVDCCLMERDGLTVIDFKTDRFLPGQEPTAHYRGQLEAYSMALSDIFKLPVKRKLLYFFHTDKLVELS